MGSITFDLHADDHIDPPYSHLWVGGVLCVLVYCMIRCLMQRAQSLRLAREADTAFDPNAPLTDGTRFISGKVEYAQGRKNAIAVHVLQAGTESHSKNGWSHEWKEFDRKTHAEPFYVRRANGERIRVEPGSDPFLVDKPDQILGISRDRRERIAILTPGEEVIVQGVLTKGKDPESHGAGNYRSTEQSWIMKRRPKRRMEVSAEKLGDRHRKRAKSFQGAFIALIWVMVITNAFFAFYHVRLFQGEDTCGEVVRKEISYSQSKKGSRSTYYDIDLRVDAPGNPKITVHLDKSDWGQVNYGSILGFRHVASHPSISLPGTGTSVYIWSIILAAFTTLIGYGYYTGSRDYRRWYERKLIDRGSGKLPDGGA